MVWKAINQSVKDLRQAMPQKYFWKKQLTYLVLKYQWIFIFLPVRITSLSSKPYVSKDSMVERMSQRQTFGFYLIANSNSPRHKTKVFIWCTFSLKEKIILNICLPPVDIEWILCVYNLSFSILLTICLPRSEVCQSLIKAVSHNTRLAAFHYLEYLRLTSDLNTFSSMEKYLLILHQNVSY